MKKKTTIIGMKLRCKTCGTVFAIGSRGIKAARERCLEHIRLKACGPEMVPINPPVGLTYVGEFGAPGYSNAPEVIYDGVDEDKFWEDVKTAGLKHFTVMSPQLELTL